jgi:HAE1 family hydrophobic/amphiphilic exporter-1
MPRDMPTPPSDPQVIRRKDPSFFDGQLAERSRCKRSIATSKTLMLGKLSSVDGVARGGNLRSGASGQSRIQVDPNALALRGIGIDEVANAISRSSVNMATGQLDGNTRARSFTPTASSTTRRNLRNRSSPIAMAGRVRFGDVALVIDGVENSAQLWRLGRQERHHACRHGRYQSPTWAPTRWQSSMGSKRWLPQLIAQMPAFHQSRRHAR